MIRVKYQSESISRTSDAFEKVITYYGTKSELADMQNQLRVNSLSADGRLNSTELRQGNADIWELTVRYARTSDGETSAEPPDTAYGRKSATLDVTMLPLPLEKSSNYRYKWNHWLWWHPSYADEPMPEPGSWYDNDTTPGNATGPWAWTSDLNRPPSDTSLSYMLCKPATKSGVTSFDWPAPTVTESARFRNAKAAGNFVGSKINEIGKPSETFGYFSGHIWKCERASVSYTGEYWLATLTWVGSPGLWDTDLYGPGAGLRDTSD